MILRMLCRPERSAACYTALGAGFGLCFPLLGTALCAWLDYGGLSPAALAEAQRGEPLLWIINAAPFLVGLLARQLGLRQERVEALNAALRHAAQEKEAIDNAMVDLLFVIDPKGRLVKWNRPFERATGLAAERLHRRPIEQLVAHADRGAVREAIRHALERGTPRMEARLLTPAGPVLFEWTGMPLYDDAGQLFGIAGAGRDVEEQRRMQEALARSEREHRGLFEHAHDAILVLDPEGETVLRANARAEALYGVPPGTLVGRSMKEFSASAAPAPAVAPEGARHFETVHRRADGALMHLEVNAASVEVEGRPALLSVNRDVTERVRQEAALRAAKEAAEASGRLKTAILQNMGHEMRTPLAEIIGWAQVLTEETSGHAHEFAGYLESSARRLVRSFDALFELARIDAGEYGLARHPVALAPLLHSLAEAARPAAREKGLRIWLDASDAAEVLADEEGLRRVLRHLLDNAVQFTAAGGIRLRASRDGARVLISVRDTGAGMSGAFLPSAFDEFTQESTGVDRRHEGLGLGLALARRLAEAMGGSISARSQVGAGTEVTVALPVAAAAAATQDAPQESAA